MISRKVFTAGVLSLTLLILAGCDSIETFHEKNKQKVADIKHSTQKSVEAIPDSENNLVFKLDLSAYEIFRNDIRPDLLETAKEIVDILDDRYNNRTSPSDEDMHHFEILLEPYIEYSYGDENFGELTLTLHEEILLRNLQDCVSYIDYNYGKYLDSLASVKGVLGQEMSFKHDAKVLKESLFTKESQIMRTRYETLLNDGYDHDEAIQQLTDIFGFKILHIQADKNDPSYVHVKFEIVLSSEPQEKKHTFQVDIDPDTWEPSYSLVYE